MMGRGRALLPLLLAIHACTLPDARSSDTPGPPNVLFIAVDDMNDWIGPLGGYPGAVHTPNLERLAQQGMTFTIEPMVNAGKRHVKLLKDGWTVVTKDRSLSAQWEHTVLVTGDRFEVLTKRDGDDI